MFLFLNNPNSLSYNGGLSSLITLTMTNIAWSQVMNISLFNSTNLSRHTPSISNNGNEITVNGFLAPYQWYFNGALINGATYFSYTTTQDGVYRVQATSVNDGEQKIIKKIFIE